MHPLDVGRVVKGGFVDIGLDGLRCGTGCWRRLDVDAALCPAEVGLAHVLRFIGNDFASRGVLERHRIAEDAEIAGFAGGQAQRVRRGTSAVAVTATRVGPVAEAQQHAVFRGGDDARCAREGGFIHDQRLGQEGFDLLHGHRRDGRVGQALGADAG
ncbi:hypothetical protein D9M68_602480 [compost metagenome]